MKYYISSDWHGDANAFRLCESKLPNTPTTVLLLGDIGLTYGDFNNVYLKELMSKSPHTYIVMRGNHDKRYVKYAKEQEGGWGWEQDAWGDNEIWYQKKYPNILYVKDEGGLYHLGDMNCLFIPGAWSIDGMYRQAHGLPWEYDEELSMIEQYQIVKIVNENRIDYVFSHDCPYRWQEELKEFFLPIKVKSQIGFNLFLNNVLGDLKNLDKWYFGHYHGNKIVGEGKGELIYQSPIFFKEI